MLQLTRQQLDKRWDVMPVNLREVLCSPDYGKIIWNVCIKNHLSDEKTGKIAGLCGYVIMGFLHPEDLAREIKEAIGINIEIANSIFQEINRKIFSLIKNEIDKIYAPPGVLTEEKLAEEAELPPVEISEEHIVDLRKLEAESRESAQKLEAPKIFTAEQKEKIPEAPITQLPSEAPFILHKQEEMKPVLGAKKSLGGLFGFLGKEEIKEEAKAPKPVAVEIQIGSMEPLKPLTPKSFGAAQDRPPAPIEIIELPKPPKPVEKTETKERVVSKLISEQPAVSRAEPQKKGFLKRIADFFKSIFIKKEIYYKEIEIPTNIEASKPLAPLKPAIPLELVKFQAIQQKKIEIPEPPKPARVVHYTELRTPLKIEKEPAVSGEFIKIEHPPQYQPKPAVEPPVKKEEITVDLRKTVESKVEPKKESGEMIDLSTMKKITE